LKILLTGHRGFLGQHLLQKLEEITDNPVWVLPKLLDIKIEKDVKDIIEISQPNIIIHLAANPRGNADLSVMDDNVKGTHNLVHYAPPQCHFIFASSIVVYGNYQYMDFIEDMECKPTSLYALSKLNAENIINRYDRLGKIRKVNYRFCAMVGNNLTHGFIFDLVNKIKSEDETLKLFGSSPGSIKPFLHVDDACNAILFAIKNNLSGTYNLCPRDNISVEQIANIAMEKLGRKKLVEWQPEMVWEGDNPEIRARNSKIYCKDFELKYRTSKETIEAYFDALNI
jgi:nucleoside-diphosphate-sugar epimerase